MPFVGKLGNRNSTGGARAKKGEMRKEEDQRGDLSFGNFKVEMVICRSEKKKEG